MTSVSFKGFSSVDKTQPFTELTDKTLIKRDILNHFNTRKGSRVMRPDYGSSLWDYLFEPLDDISRDAILDDVNTVIRSDPRVQILNTDIQEEEHGITISFQLRYVSFDTIDIFTIGFDRRNMTAQEITG
ncbi:MAG: GPW/gp25 family protein [Gammaproteobacteria bacterium]|nr:GPW/gp25 family protein [Gammaproteobacteria bacterium]